MLAFSISDTKSFMSHLLKGDIFDGFTFRQGEIHSYMTITLDGKKSEEHITEEDTEPYCLWRDVKPLIFQAVKGKILPKSMKLVFSLTERETQGFTNTKAVFLNLLFRDGSLLCTASSTEESFSLDKRSSDEWEKYVTDFFKANEIPIEEEV